MIKALDGRNTTPRELIDTAIFICIAEIFARRPRSALA